MAKIDARKRIALLWKISIGFFLGLVFGISAGPIAPMWTVIGDYVIPFVDLIGKIFLRLLMMLIVPLVFASLVSGAASIGDVRKLGRIGFKTLALYLVTTAVAIIIGLLCGNIFQPGAGMDIPGNIQAAAREAKPFFDVILEIFPTNPVSSMSSSNMLQIIVFALFLGSACVMAGEKGKRVSGFFGDFAEVMYTVTHMVMEFAPYGVFALIAGTVSKLGLSVLLPLAKVIIAVYTGCVVHILIVYAGMITLMCHKSPVWYLRGIRESAITAFVTRSSSGTLPVTLSNVRENLGVPEGISSFVLPLGATINMDGTALYQGVCALFVAQAFNVPLTLQTQTGIVLTATLASIGTAGVPGAGLIMLTMVLNSAGLPVEGVALVAGIDVILDAARTCLNVMGDSAVCAVVSSSEAE